jgi:hypothetical protein
MLRLIIILISVFYSAINFAQETFINQQFIDDVTILSHDSLEGREIGTKGEVLAADYIAKRYTEIGLKKGNNDSYFQIFTKKQPLHPHDTSFFGPEISGRNIIGFIDNNAQSNIIIGAHYDHLGWGAEGSLYTGDSMVHNGADDNASGIAALLFLAENLSLKKLKHNVIFVAFSGEEKGLLGSNYFVNNSPFQLKNTSFMVNMDMIGRLDNERRLAIYGVGTSPIFIPTIHQIEEPTFQFKFDSSGVGPSDHTSFYLNDIPVLHFFTGQHEQYHKPNDDVELINFEGLNDISLFISQLVTRLDSEDKIVFTKTREKENSNMGFKVTLGIIPDYLYSEIGLKIDGVKENRPAGNAGMLKGDIIVKMGNLKINNIDDYMRALSTFGKGEKVKVIVTRNQTELKFTVTF